MPTHVAIIMDGNGRWAKRQHLPRVAGHRRGVEAVRATVRACAERGIGFLTLFAFSSENWRRPAEEVALLMQLFQMALDQRGREAARNGVRLKVVGDTRRFDEPSAARSSAASGSPPPTTAHAHHRGELRRPLGHPAGGEPVPKEASGRAGGRSRGALLRYLAMSYAPEPDLFIRTGGEQRISNFLLWQLAYTELYFTDTLWPDFDAAALDRSDRLLPQPRAALRAHQRAARAPKRAEVA